MFALVVEYVPMMVKIKDLWCFGVAAIAHGYINYLFHVPQTIVLRVMMGAYRDTYLSLRRTCTSGNYHACIIDKFTKREQRAYSIFAVLGQHPCILKHVHCAKYRVSALCINWGSPC